MAKPINTNLLMSFSWIFIVLLVHLYPFEVYAQGAYKVTTYRDNRGWKLLVNGKDYYVKGVVWGYVPRGENYNYNLWNKSDQHIRAVLDYEFSLMKNAGINTIRAFSNIPPKWISYIYKQYGIMTAINPLVGRYGSNVGGLWRPFTDYSDPLTRDVLKAEVLAIVKKYKDTPGLLMYALGNENNYGLDWTSFEIENLPVGERQKEKARYLYSLYNEIIKAARVIDPNLPYTIVNGDIQYIDLIRQYTPELDLLGTNVYRGISFGDLWKDVRQKLDIPVLLFEFGSDAFNARDFTEDQTAQASYLRGQWQEMYSKSYGHGQEGNSIGGFVFEWRDEWWKYKQTENLDVHDRNASWSNGGYTFDYVEGQNNMNEEWFGIMSLGQENKNGVYEAQPRMAYDVLTEIWRIDPYKQGSRVIAADIRNIDMDFYALKSDVRQLKNKDREKQGFELAGGSVELEFVLNGFSGDIDEFGREAVENTNGQMVFLDFEFNPNDNLTGQFSINILGNVADKIMEISYGRRGLPYTGITTGEIVDGVNVTEELIEDNERVEIYDFNATYSTHSYDLLGFYHTPRFHWGYEGDFYGLLRETTDMLGQDIWNSKAPYGVEFQGKQNLDGLKFLFGPEVYWGANPKAMIKYQFDLGNNELAFIHAEDLARRDDSSSATAATQIQTRQTTLYSKSSLTASSDIELGAIMASTEKIGDEYSRYENGNIVVDEIKFEDTLGIKATLSFDMLSESRGYIGINYGGLVADGGDPLKGFGVRNGINNFTELPYSQYGNKKEIDAGVQLNFGSITILPRVLYRENLVDANPTLPAVTTGTSLFPGLSPRNRDDNAFAVLDNRAARSAEIVLTYDPTPDTGFYEWDNDRREDADFAFNLGANYTRYPTATDAYQFFYRPTGVNAAFDEGLVAEDVWKVLSRMVFNTESGTNVILNLEAGYQQSTGSPDGSAQKYYEAGARFMLTNDHIIETYVYKDAWGPYDFYRQFNVTYPYQFKLDYSVLMGKLNYIDPRGATSKWGVRALYRTLDEQSPEDEYQDGRNNSMFEIITYVTFSF